MLMLLILKSTPRNRRHETFIISSLTPLQIFLSFMYTISGYSKSSCFASLFVRIHRYLGDWMLIIQLRFYTIGIIRIFHACVVLVLYIMVLCLPTTSPDRPYGSCTLSLSLLSVCRVCRPCIARAIQFFVLFSSFV